MKPLIVLLAAFLISALIIKITKKEEGLAFAGRIALSFMLTFTAMGHFLFTEGMAMMIPDFVPLKTEMVYLTGIFELAATITIHMPKLRKLTGWTLMIFFILVLPSNIKAAIEHVDYKKATYTGKGPEYLWFRVPAQLLYIAWAYFSCVRDQSNWLQTHLKGRNIGALNEFLGF